MAGGRVGQFVLVGHRTRVTIVLRSVHGIVGRVGSPRLYMPIDYFERVYIENKKQPI